MSLLVISVLRFAATPALRADFPRVTIFDADGQTTSGSMQDWSSDSIRLATADKRSWNWRDVVTVRFDDRPAPATPRGAAIWLANGDRLIAHGIGIADEQLKFRWPKVAGELDRSVPIEAVRGLSLALPHAR